MADFTGMTVQVTLKHPSNTILHGRVKEVVAGQTLTLQDVFFPSTGARWEHWTVQGTAVADLQVVNSNTAPTTRSNGPPIRAPPIVNPQFSRQQQQRPTPPPQSQPQRTPSTFVDPAILSYGKSPAPARAAQAPVEAPATPVKIMMAKAAEGLPVNGSPFVAEPSNVNARDGHTGRAEQETIPPTSQRAQVASQAAGPTVPIVLEDGQENGEAGARKKVRPVRRGQKKKGATATATSSDPPPVMNIEVSRNGNDMDGTVRRAKGWRQTPLLQPSPQATSPAEKPVPKQTRRQRDAEAEKQNGWATEDATDVQGMDDFDFEASNKLFDKKGVFDQLRQDDTTADEARLVSHNKAAPRPGTHGGKNLLPTENVLSPKLGAKYNSNEVDSTSDADTELNGANGRSSSRHSTTRSLLGKKVPSRQNSAQLDGKPHPLTTSLSSDRGGLSRSAMSLASRGGRPVPSIAATSPRPDGARSPQSAISTTKTAAASAYSVLQEPHFLIPSTLSVCPVLHPSAIETLESETTSRYGLSPDAITESAARSIAELAMSMFDPVGNSRRGSRANTAKNGSMTSSSNNIDRSSTPVIVVLAGNHSLGARAVAAARHLASRDCEVIVAEAQYESAEVQDPQMKTQTAMLRRMLRAGAGIKRGNWRKASNYIKNLAGPPVAIIDALLAGSTYDDIVSSGSSNAQHATVSQEETRAIIDWANRSRAPVLSIGCPSGVSGLDGSATLVEGEPLAVRPDKVLTLGAPMQGLLEAMKGGEKWDVRLADIGVNIALRRDETVKFGGQWVVELRYMAGEESET